MARLLVGVFFRSIEVEGLADLPASGPTVLVANHQNGLVDGLVLIAALPRYPRFLGKATLWRIVPLRPLLALAGVIRIHRVHEVGATPSAADREAGNDAAFASARALLGEGGVVAIFPEGVSHDELTLHDLRTGAARIALDAGDPTVVAPAGLVYDDKSRFRSRALVRLGPARPVTGYPNDREGVRVLTADIATDLRAVAPDFPDVDEARRWASLAALAAGGTLADQADVARHLADVARDPVAAAELEACERELTDLAQAAALLGLDVAALTTDLGPAGARVAEVVAAMPAAIVGLGVHALPFTVIRLLARLPKNVGMRATIKVGGSLGLYTLTYAGIGVAVGRRRGWIAGLGAALAAPLCGWLTLLMGERLEAIGGLARLGEVLRQDRAGVAILAGRRDELAAQIQDLLSVA